MSGPITWEQLERWLEETHRFDQRWERKESVLSLYRPLEQGSGPGLLVKQSPGWHADDAATAFETLHACREAAEGRGEPHFVARPERWGVDPPFLCVEWIDGENLMRFMQARLSRDGASTWFLDALSAAGALLALYHAAVTEWPVSAHDDMEMDGPWLRVARGIAGSAASSAVVPIRTFSDPSPANMVIDERGRLWLVDVPSSVEVRAAQWDAALLAYRFGRMLKWELPTLPGKKVSYGAVFDAVRAGYASQLPGVLDSKQSTVLFYAFLATEAMRGLRGKWLRGRTARERLQLVPATGRMIGRSLVTVVAARWSARREQTE